jgi:hypothetical protein
MATTEKVDLYKDNKKEYAATPKPALVEIGPAVYLSISGRGAPGGNAFSDAIGALYGVAFTVKMTRKFAGKPDYAVCKLEALWPNLNWDDTTPDREQWVWQLMIRTPKFVAAKDINQAIETSSGRNCGRSAKGCACRHCTWDRTRTKARRWQRCGLLPKGRSCASLAHIMRSTCQIRGG